MFKRSKRNSEKLFKNTGDNIVTYASTRILDLRTKSNLFKETTIQGQASKEAASKRDPFPESPYPQYTDTSTHTDRSNLTFNKATKNNADRGV